MKIEVFTDGSGTTKNQSAGFGWVLIVDGEFSSEGNGYIEKGTNNDAEMMAAINGLKAALQFVVNKRKDNPDLEVSVTLCSDSQITLGWADGSYRFKQEAKMDKFAILKGLVNRMNVKTKWVKGHSGHELNERADRLANLGRLGLGPNDSLPGKKSVKSFKKFKINDRTESVRCFNFNGTIKIVDFHRNLVEDYREDIHGPRKIQEVLNE